MERGDNGEGSGEVDGEVHKNNSDRNWRKSAWLIKKNKGRVEDAVEIFTRVYW